MFYYVMNMKRSFNITQEYGVNEIFAINLECMFKVSSLSIVLKFLEASAILALLS